MKGGGTNPFLLQDSWTRRGVGWHQSEEICKMIFDEPGIEISI